QLRPEPRELEWRGRLRHLDWLGLLAATAAVVALALIALRPASLQRDLAWGHVYVPYTGEGPWLTPIGVTVVAAVAVLLLRCTFARNPLVDLRGWFRSALAADLLGALLLAGCLSGIILAFATADPEVQVFSA